MVISKTSKITLITLFAYLLLTSSVLHAADEPGDASIISAIERRMLTDGGVRSHSMEVRASNGIVTLSGSVDNILARDRAIEIARSINGVRSVVNMIEVKASERSDEEIRRDVRDALEADPVTDYLQIGVKVENGVVTLTGTVGSYGEKAL
jgi:osmotically-inducible protein OsmY